MASSNAYSSGVPPFSAGDKLSASALERMREADQRSLPQRSLGAFVRQTPGGTIVSPIQRRRSASPHPFRVFDASDEEGLKVIVHYGAVIDVSNWRNPQVVDPQIEGKSLIPDPENGERPRVALPEEGEKIFVLLVIALNPSGQIDFPEEEEAAASVTIEAYSEEELPDKLAQPNKVFIHIARIEVAESEEDSKRTIKRMDQILGSHVLWPQKAVHPFQVFDASDESGLKISVAYGAVIDMTDWQNTTLHVPKMNGEELPASIFGEMPKLPVSGSGSGVYVVIKQGENGEIAGHGGAVEIQVLDQLPDISDGTLHVQIAELSVEGSGEKQSVSIKQILGSHIVWPFKPDFVGWRQKKQSAPSAFWLGSGSSYGDCDILSDLFVQVQREDFDNGRDGDQVFMLRMEEDENVEFTLDKDNRRGFQLFMGDDMTKLALDRKNTAASGITLQSKNDEASCSVTGPSEGGGIRSAAKQDEAKVEITSPEATIRMKASGQEPRMDLEGQGTTRVTTIAGKEIAMREITYMESQNSSKRAYFLCSIPEDDYNPGDHHSDHHAAGGSHGNHHADHFSPDHGSNHQGHHTSHHAGHFDPNHSPNNDSNHTNHHSGHGSHDDDDNGGEPHHSNHQPNS